MKKKIVVIFSSILILSGLGIYFYLGTDLTSNVVSTPEEEVKVYNTAIQCRGSAVSREVTLKNKYKIYEAQSFNEEELKEFAYYQLLYAFSNFQYSPLSNRLQFAQMRQKPEITLNKVDHHTYGRELSGSVSLPEFLNIKNLSWPKEIKMESNALTVQYSANFTLDFCLKDLQTNPENFTFYTPLDPVYAYYTLPREHWTYRELEPWGKTIDINLCQNLHHFFEKDAGFAKNYWYLWNPTKRGKEMHTLHYECLDWLKENEDYLKLNIVMKPSETLKVLPTKKNSHHKKIKMRIITHDEKQDFSYYEASIPQIFEGHNFLSTLPDISQEDYYIFRLLEGLSKFIVAAKLEESSRDDLRDRFLFKAINKNNEKVDFILELGREFSDDENCDVGLTYSSFVETEKRFLSFDDCAKEAFFIPLASQFAQLLEIKPSEARRFYLMGQPGLADASTGAYLWDYFQMKDPNLEIGSYIEQTDREEGFFIIPAN